MHLTRRRWLRRMGGPVLLIGLAGTAGEEPDGDDQESPTPTGTSGELPPNTNGTGACGDATSDTRPAGTGGPGVTLVSVDACPALPVRPAVEVVREAATPEHPPQLRTRLTNTAGESVRVGEGRAVHFEHVTDESGALVLLPAASTRPTPTAGGCTRASPRSRSPGPSKSKPANRAAGRSTPTRRPTATAVSPSASTASKRRSPSSPTGPSRSRRPSGASRFCWSSLRYCLSGRAIYISRIKFV